MCEPQPLAILRAFTACTGLTLPLPCSFPRGKAARTWNGPPPSHEWRNYTTVPPCVFTVWYLLNWSQGQIYSYHYTGWKTDKSGLDYWQRQEILFSIMSGPAWGSTQPPIQWVPGAVPLVVKRPECEAEVKNADTISPLPIRLHGVVLDL
jgi:hypothetical protein